MPRQPVKKAPPAKPGRPARKPEKKTRRTPYDLVQSLKGQRENLLHTFGERIAKLDQRISDLEAKHAQRIAIAELTQSKTPEELEQEEQSLRAQLAIMKKARKAVSG